MAKAEKDNTIVKQEHKGSSTNLTTSSYNPINIPVIYNYAHIRDKNIKTAKIEVVNDKTAIISVHDTSNSNPDLLVKILPNSLTTLSLPSNLDIDLYSGIVAINKIFPDNSDFPNNSDTIYQNMNGYCVRKIAGHGKEKTVNFVKKPLEEFGIIHETPPRMEALFINKLAFVESLQNGLLKFFTSSFEKTLSQYSSSSGYVMNLDPEEILSITQNADRRLKTPQIQQQKMKEVKEEKRNTLSTNDDDSLQIEGQSSNSSSSSSNSHIDLNTDSVELTGDTPSVPSGLD